MYVSLLKNLATWLTRAVARGALAMALLAASPLALLVGAIGWRACFHGRSKFQGEPANVLSLSRCT